jgi:cystathionine beta-synthase
MQVFSNVLDMVGRTPMLEVTNLDTGPCRLFLKLELANPGGSIKDRIGISMIEEAEKRGDLKPGDTIVEATAGNTGLGLALVAQQKGYPLILVLPDKMSQEKIFNLRAMGAEVILTRSDVVKGDPEYYQDLGKAIADEKGAYFINQFGNPDNPLAHERTTAPEIFEQMDGDVDAIVLGAGSCGTAAGFSQYLKNSSYDTELILADPVGSILADYVNKGVLTTKGITWLVEGIGEDFIPDITDFDKTSSLILQILTKSLRPTASAMENHFKQLATCCTKKAFSQDRQQERWYAQRSSSAASRRKQNALLPVQAIQRFLAGGPGFHHTRTTWRSARPGWTAAW